MCVCVCIEQKFCTILFILTRPRSLFLYIYIYIGVCVCVYVCVHVHVCMCVEQQFCVSTKLSILSGTCSLFLLIYLCIFLLIYSFNFFSFFFFFFFCSFLKKFILMSIKNFQKKNTIFRHFEFFLSILLPLLSFVFNTCLRLLISYFLFSFSFLRLFYFSFIEQTGLFSLDTATDPREYIYFYLYRLFNNIRNYVGYIMPKSSGG